MNHRRPSRYLSNSSPVTLSVISRQATVTGCLVVMIVGCPTFGAWAQEPPSVAGDGQPGDSQESATPLFDLLLSEEDRELLRSGDRDLIYADRAPTIDDAAMNAAGIRKLVGKHLVLYTDVPAHPAVDELPRVFDRAIPLWCEYFGVAEEKVADWTVTGYLIQDKQRHQNAQLFPANLPNFLHGYQRGRELWIYEQPGAYYRRHLLLHEGVHGFMAQFLGGTGPPWYREGIAELLATHRWKDHKLRVGVMPASREEVPYWGRIKIIKQEYEAGRGLMLREIMRFDQSAHLRLEPYAWCWAAAAFLDGHPRFRQPFRALVGKVTDSTAFFTRDFEAQFTATLRELDEEWQLFVVNIDYGYDLSRNMVQYAPGIRTPGDGQETTIATDRGWQSSGLRLEKGKIYRVRAKGRFQLRQNPEWWSEPGGVTLQYAAGQPLGMLVGNIRLDQPEPGTTNLGNPIPIGLNRRIVAAETGTLYLKVNDSPGKLSDNVGQVTVKVIEDEVGAVRPRTDDDLPEESVPEP